MKKTGRIIKVNADSLGLEPKGDLPASTVGREYASWLAELKRRYQRQQIKASVHVNQAMLEFYWELGHDIVERDWENVYGSGFFRKLSGDLRKNLDSPQGFSENNLRYMRSFYRLYAPFIQNLQQPVGESAMITKEASLSLSVLFSIPWGHHIQIIPMGKPPALPGRLAEFDSYGNGCYIANGSPKLEAMEDIHDRNRE